MNFPILEDLEYICNLTFNMYKIPIHLLDKEGNVIFEPPLTSYWHPLPSINKEGILEQLFSENHTFQIPIFSGVAYFEHFFSINILSKGQFYGKVIVGPILFTRVPEESMFGVINDLDLKVRKEEMIHYYDSLPVLSQLDFINMSMGLYYMLYQEKLDLVDLHQKNILGAKPRFHIDHPDVYLSEQRQQATTRRDPLSERKMFQYIKEGKTDELKALRIKMTEVEVGVLSKGSYLRNIKNLVISGITLACRAAIDGGLNPEIALNLSDLFIQKLEELNNINDIAQLSNTAFLEFTERVAKGKKHQYSKPINMCQNYIFTHLYNEVTVPHLADLVEMNPNYLSNLFKKEVGISIIEYIHQAKVEEAKNLITFTDHPLSEISGLLNFHDQSYFTKVFKRFTGVTPNQYKKGIVGSKEIQNGAD
ncbi:helix-turn-helix domain-containing protein [Litchfieldia alkalitelluris]|uniref:helix-turn-helix domain-containing protein n=1 Tax=Litchfieldia alkalitelluris TaxID=304268 RepID=UPI000997F7E8|nr:helix-turn-helix domain-containing protein [Litchfieldia alkalitelluris]